MIRRPPRSTLFPTRRSSDLGSAVLAAMTNGASVLQERVHGRRADIQVELRMRTPRIERIAGSILDRKSTRLNSSHVRISYAVFCLKKKKQGNKSLFRAEGYI